MRSVFTLILSLAVAALIYGQNDVKGQHQLAGGAAQFGKVYSLKNNFNFEILAARYTLEAYDAYYPMSADSEHKIVVIDIALKDATQDDQDFNTDGFMTLVDDHGDLFPNCSMMLESRPRSSDSVTLKPGQGLGQPALKDPLHLAFLVPAKSRIDKILVNVGRLNTSEDVVRYLLVEPPKSSEKSENVNYIKPLAANEIAPGDRYGAGALPEGKGEIGAYVPSGMFDIRLDTVSAADDAKFDGNPPDDGNRFFVMTVTAKATTSGDAAMSDVEGDGPAYRLFDADGNEYKPIGFRKPSADEEPEKDFKLGQEASCRVFFAVPKAAKITRAVYGTGQGSRWSVDIPLK